MGTCPGCKTPNVHYAVLGRRNYSICKYCNRRKYHTAVQLEKDKYLAGGRLGEPRERYYNNDHYSKSKHQHSNQFKKEVKTNESK